MYEDRPEKDTPPEIRQMLTEYGGKTAEGWPAWRLVLAQNCRMQCFGRMSHAPKVKDTSDLDLRELTPERTEEGSYWIPRYRAKGWILQRWFPPHTWGTRQAWEQEKAHDGIHRLRGKYPENGDYFLLAGPWNSIDEAGDLRACIQQWNRAQMSNPNNFEVYFRQEMRRERREQQEEFDRFETTLEIYRKTEILPVLKGSSQAAQRVRNRIQQGLGQGKHLGACEAWGS